MSWTYGSVQIFPQEINDTDVQTVARLHPFGGGTIHHRFGYEDPITRVNAYVIGFADRNTLRGYKENGTVSSFTHTGWGVWCSGYLKQAEFKVLNNVCQTLRPDLDEDAPVFVVELEIYQE